MGRPHSRVLAGLRELQSRCTGRVRKRWRVLLFAALGVGCRPASPLRIPSAEWTPRYEGVRTLSVELTEPRPLRVHVVEVDLMRGPRLVPSGSNGDRPLDVDGQTTLDFAVERDCQVAINTSPFDPVVQQPGAPKDLVGIAITDGELFSKPHRRYGAFAISDDGSVGILDPPIQEAELSSVRHAVGGFQPLLSDGRDVSGVSTHVRGRHPRTAVGVSRDGKRVWLLVVDGRQRGFSEGVSLRELARLMASLGADDALNLDGGGSTTLVMRRGDDAYVVNSPIHDHVPGRLRVVGSSLCVFAEPLAAVSSG